MYTTLPAQETAMQSAALRLKRLNKPKNNWICGMAMDLVMGAGPWVAGMIAICTGVMILSESLGSGEDTNSQGPLANFAAPAVVGAISTFAGFLLVTRQSTNLANNAKIIGEFGNLSGSLINISLFLKSQISSGKSIDFLTLSDGSGGFFQTTRIGLVCASVMYVVKYTGRGVPIRPEGLPIGQDARLLNAYNALVSPKGGSPGMAHFSACILLIGELVDEFQVGEKASEYAVLFSQLNAVTAAEGAIGGTAGYGAPYLMKWLLPIVYVLYLSLLAISELVPNNEWNSLWIGAIIAFCTISFYQISERYGNPMKLRSRMSGQKPMVSIACVDTEVAITSIFARNKAALVGGDGGILTTGVRFKLGSQ
jgi:hypothetical protein